MDSDYYADVYKTGCGELVQESCEVDESDPDIVVLTIRAYKP